MTYLQAIREYIDSDGLIAKDRFPKSTCTGGNQILETAFACALIEQYPETDESKALYQSLKQAVLNCKSDNGLYNKNPGRPDQITFDCLIGAAHISEETAKVITDFGKTHYWVLSNTGKLYFTAISRPQYIAYYQICAEEKPNKVSLGLLYLSLLSISSDPGGLRLQYLIADKLQDYSSVGKWFYHRLMRHILEQYGSMKALHAAYYGNNEQFNTIYFKG